MKSPRFFGNKLTWVFFIAMLAGALAFFITLTGTVMTAVPKEDGTYEFDKNWENITTDCLLIGLLLTLTFFIYLIVFFTNRKKVKAPAVSSSDRVLCPKCGKENPATAHFCIACGASLDGAAKIQVNPSVIDISARPTDDPNYLATGQKDIPVRYGSYVIFYFHLLRVPFILVLVLLPLSLALYTMCYLLKEGNLRNEAYIFLVLAVFLTLYAIFVFFLLPAIHRKQAKKFLKNGFKSSYDIFRDRIVYHSASAKNGVTHHIDIVFPFSEATSAQELKDGYCFYFMKRKQGLLINKDNDLPADVNRFLAEKVKAIRGKEKKA